MIRTFGVAALLLDETNPRYADPTESQANAINGLLADAADKLVNLAEDIAKEGTNPTELPIVVEEDGQPVVVEGNRRLAALKLLRNPDLAREPSLRKRFRNLAELGHGPDTVECYLAESREAARHWITLRHTGENNGVGILEWNTLQSNTFRRRRGSQADTGAVFCVAAEKAFPNDADLLQNIATVRKDRLTTLGRLVADPDVKRDLGYDINGEEVVHHFTSSRMLSIIGKLFADLAGPVGVSQIKSKELRREYIRSISDVIPPQSERLGEPVVAGAVAQPGSTQGSSSPPTSRRSTHREERVIFKGLSLTQVDLRTAKVLQQAQRVDIESLPAVAAVMVRVIVELVVTEAATRLSWSTLESAPLKKKIRAALMHLDPDCEQPTKREKALEPAWIRSQDDQNGVAVQAMNAFVHNVMANPTASEVRELSRTYRIMLERLDADLAAQRPRL